MNTVTVERHERIDLDRHLHARIGPIALFNRGKIQHVIAKYLLRYDRYFPLFQCFVKVILRLQHRRESLSTQHSEVVKIEHTSIKKPQKLLPSHLAAGKLKVLARESVLNELVVTQGRRDKRRLARNGTRINDVVVEIPEIVRLLWRFQVFDDQDRCRQNIELDVGNERPSKRTVSYGLLPKVRRLLIQRLARNHKRRDTSRFQGNDSAFEQGLLLVGKIRSEKTAHRSGVQAHRINKPVHGIAAVLRLRR